MSSIPIGVKQKVPLLVEKEKACKTVEEENSDTDDINIIDIWMSLYIVKLFKYNQSFSNNLSVRILVPKNDIVFISIFV